MKLWFLERKVQKSNFLWMAQIKSKFKISLARRLLHSDSILTRSSFVCQLTFLITWWRNFRTKINLAKTIFQLVHLTDFYIFFVQFPLKFFGRRPRFAGSLTTRAGFWGHVAVEADAIEVRDEHVDENFRDCFTGADRVAVLVMNVTWSCSATRCVGVMRLTDTFFTSWKVAL